MSTLTPPILSNQSLSVGLSNANLMSIDASCSSSVIRGKLSQDSLPDNTMVVMEDGTLGISRNGKFVRMNELDEYKDELVVDPSFFVENANLTVSFHEARCEEEETTILYRVDEKHYKLVYYGCWIMLLAFPVIRKGVLERIVTDHISIERPVTNPKMRVLVPVNFAGKTGAIAEKMIGSGVKIQQTIGFSADSRVNKIVAPSGSCDLKPDQEAEMKDQLEKYSMMFK
jgi:hypothetical protein